jgi:multidrug efflux system outer membrane protein
MRKQLWCLLFLSGCMVGPDLNLPNLQIAQDWNEEGFLTTASETLWWKQLNDEVLCSLIMRGVEGNHDVKLAQIAIEKSKALTKISSASLFPQLGIDINANRINYSKNGPLFDSSSSLGGGGVHFPKLQNTFNAVLNQSWEIDLFGKTRKEVEKAKAEEDLAAATKQEVILSLIQEIADKYIEFRGTQQKLKLQQEIVSVALDNDFLEVKRFEKGLVSAIEPTSSKIPLLEEQKSLYLLQLDAFKQVYCLSFLLGLEPQILLEELKECVDLPTVPSEISVGIRTDLLKKRPDIRQREFKLASATAGVGVAIGAFFPSFSLSLSPGLQAIELGKLFQLASKTWSYGEVLQIPLFQGGRLQGNLEISKAEQVYAAIQFQKTFLKALEEVETALKNFNFSKKIVDDSKLQYEESKKYLLVAQKQSDLGLISKKQFLSYQNKYLKENLQLISDRVAEIKSLIDLYGSLGGGWEPFFKD